MRVLCIDATPNPEMGFAPEVIEGQVYTVLRDGNNPASEPSYKLAECILVYAKRRFVPCSNQDNLVLEDVLLEVNH